MSYKEKLFDVTHLLDTKFTCLDKGFVRVVDVMGNDDAVVQAARVSYGAGTKTVREDQELINYLMRHRHTTPFEMCEIKFHIKLPIFVARQWIRHRTASVNEYSARYSEVKDEFYMPSISRVHKQSTRNKQGSENGEDKGLTPAQAKDFLNSCEEVAESSMMYYRRDINDYGIAKELARINMPVSNYTEWYWKIDLHNLLHFLRLRMDPHAQFEIRTYADAISNVVAIWVPKVWDAFEQYCLNSLTFSRKELKVLSHLIGEKADSVDLFVSTPKDDNFSKGEWKEFLEKLQQFIAR